jgi:hypothetical protein
MHHLVVPEHQVAAVEIDVVLLGIVPRHDVTEAGDLGRFHFSSSEFISRHRFTHTPLPR